MREEVHSKAGDEGRQRLEEHGDDQGKPGSRPALRAALGKLKARLGRAPVERDPDGAGDGGGPFDAFRLPPDASRKKEKKKEALEEHREKRKALEAGEDIKGTTSRPSRKETDEKKVKPPDGVLAELVHKASKPPTKKRAGTKKSKSKMTAMALMKTLAKGLGLKKFKGLEEKKRKKEAKRKSDPEDPEDSDDSQKSENSETESSGSGSGHTSGEERERSEMEKATPPLERMSQKRTGSVLKLFVQHMRESLQNLDEGEGQETATVTGGVSAIKYWHLIVKPQVAGRMKEAREMYCLLQACPQRRPLGPDGRPPRGQDHGNSPVSGRWRQLESSQALGDPPFGVNAGFEYEHCLAGEEIREDRRPCAGCKPSALAADQQGRKVVARRGRWWQRWQRKRQKQERQRKRRERKRTVKGLEAEPGASAREGRQLNKGVLKEILESAHDMSSLGDSLAWLITRLAIGGEADTMRVRLGLEAVKHRAGRDTSRPSRSLLPVPAGLNQELVDHLRSQRQPSSFEKEAMHAMRRAPFKPVAPQKHQTGDGGEEPWLSCVSAGCNLLAGHKTLLPPGEASALQRSALDQMRSTLRRSLAPNQDLRWLEKDCARELQKTHVSYTGEEVEVAQTLTFEQMEPALPPEGFGGKIDILEHLSIGSRSWLTSPCRLLRDACLFGDFKFEAKIHIAEKEKVGIAKALVSRGVCDWIPLAEVFEHHGRKLFNGMFGVKKDSLTLTGKPVLRTIMNLTPCNCLFHPLEAGHSSLPDIHAWTSIVMSWSEVLETSQSDMSAAFYLFKIPGCWKRFLSFRIICDGSEINKTPREQYCLCCAVLPMGWHSSVSLMQEASANILAHSQLDPKHQLTRNLLAPAWMVNLTGLVEPGHRDWWQVYLDNFASAQLRDEYEVAEAHPEPWQRWHSAAEVGWDRAGIVSSEKKRVRQSQEASELGAYIDGKNRFVGGSPLRFLKTAKLILYMLFHEFTLKNLQTVVGRIIFVMSFRRPTMSVFTNVWTYIAKPNLRRKLLPHVRRELFNALLLFPIMKNKI